MNLFPWLYDFYYFSHHFIGNKGRKCRTLAHAMRTSKKWFCSTVSLLDFVTRHSTVGSTSRTLSDRQRSVALISNSSTVFENLAAEDALLRGVVLQRREALLFMYVNRPCVVIGRNQNIFTEVSLRTVLRDRVDVSRRSSGGGAVYHDLGNVSFSVFTHREAYDPRRSIQLLRWHLCCVYGIDPKRITTTKRHDLFLDGMKITGSAMRVQRDIACHHFTLLVSSSRELLGKYLKSEGHYTAFTTAAVPSVRSPTTTLQEAGVLPVPMDGNPVECVLQSMATFFVKYSWDILLHEAPWDADSLNFCADGCAERSRPPHGRTIPNAIFTLDTKQAVLEETLMIDGENRRPYTGAPRTVGEQCAHLQSADWLFNMPKFETRITITSAELLEWGAASAAGDRFRPEVLACLLQSHKGVDIVTVVECRRVTLLEACWVDEQGDGNMKPWFACLLTYLVEGKYVDGQVVAVEGTDNVLCAAIELECSQIVSDLSAIPLHTYIDCPCGSKETSSCSPSCGEESERERGRNTIERFLRVILEVWRDKNVFFPLV